MKRSTAIAIVVAGVLLFVAILIAAGMLWGLTGIRAVTLCYILIGAPLLLWAHKRHMRWEVILLGFGYLVYAAALATSLLARGGAAGEVAPIVLIFTAAACMWAGAIGMWRRLLQKRRRRGSEQETAEGA